jgi:hypothetical protein
MSQLSMIQFEDAWIQFEDASPEGKINDVNEA